MDIKLCRRSSLFLKTLDPAFIAAGVRVQNLERHLTLHDVVFTQVNHAHAAFAERTKQFVGPQKEAFALSGEQLAGLPPRQQTCVLHPIGQTLRSEPGVVGHQRSDDSFDLVQCHHTGSDGSPHECTGLFI